MDTFLLTSQPTRRVGGNVGHQHAALWAVRTVHVGHPRGFQPVGSVLNKNHFLFILNSIQIQVLEFISLCS
jgi:hypothetical protein